MDETTVLTLSDGKSYLEALFLPLLCSKREHHGSPSPPEFLWSLEARTASSKLKCPK
jgi:hypothetical protein